MVRRECGQGRHFLCDTRTGNGGNLAIVYMDHVVILGQMMEYRCVSVVLSFN